MLRIRRGIIAGIAILSITMAAGHTSYANTHTPLYKANATAYCLIGTTASGEQTRIGICASKREWLGKTVVVYQRLPSGEVGTLIGIYECKDTGGAGIESGNVIDIWCEDLDKCQDFMNRVYEDNCKGKVYIQIIDAEG